MPMLHMTILHKSEKFAQNESCCSDGRLEPQWQANSQPNGLLLP